MKKSKSAKPIRSVVCGIGLLGLLGAPAHAQLLSQNTNKDEPKYMSWKAPKAGAIPMSNKASSNKLPKGFKMPANIERAGYPEEKFMEQMPVTLLNIPQKPGIRSLTNSQKTQPEYEVKGFNFKISEVTTQAPGVVKVEPAKAMPAIDPLRIPEAKPLQDNLKPYDDYSKAEIQMFESYVILDDQKNPLPAYGTFAKLAQNKSSYQESAKWGLARAALALNLRVQYETLMLEMMEKSLAAGKKDWGNNAYNHLVTNSDATRSVWVHSLSERHLHDSPTNKTSDAYFILRGLRFAAQKIFDEAMKDFSQVGPKSPLYGQRVYQESLILYRQGKLGLALQALREVFEKHPDAFKGNDDLKTRAALLWGRLAFQSREFKQAFTAYQSVPKNSPQFPEAMMEQALTQVMYQDYEGAAGNMFTLHTDFFKKSYAPESYLIRTVGYLNLCQYADAHKVVQDLQRKYKPILDAVEKYQKSANASADYDLIRKFAKNPGAPEVNGIPRPFLFAWTQDTGFERHQERVNQIEDEIANFGDLNVKTIKAERDLAARIISVSQKLNKATADKDKVNSGKLQAELDYIKIEHRMLGESRKSLQGIREAYFEQMDELKGERKKLAADSLAGRRSAMLKQLRHIIDQSDILLYEIYSGAGDHMRYENAGGKVEETKSAQLKGIKENEVKWKYKGEIWEDELGHFRSSLTNVCTKDDELPKQKSKPQKVSNNR